jgi:hypothetical protein
MTYSNGDYYQGNWKEDKRHGYGIYYTKGANETFKGIFKDNLANGYGVLESGSDKAIYKGLFKSGYCHGDMLVVYGDSLDSVKNSSFSSILALSNNEETLLKAKFEEDEKAGTTVSSDYTKATKG